jgi:UDP-N-acetylglucosamine 2-epimerase (non-hydrolysing)
VKLLTVFGTRPEIIRLSAIVRTLDRFCDQVLVHTGQNYDPSLSDIFLRELSFRTPDINLGVHAHDFARQTGEILTRFGDTLASVRPDRLLVLGDTNSGLCAIVAARAGVRVYHLEAGNRCYDKRVPEEINRRIIDHASDVLLPYTHRSKENLMREGIERERIFVVGNPIYEVLTEHSEQIAARPILADLELEPNGYVLATLHRAENVDLADRLQMLLAGLERVHRELALPVVVSLHPRTRNRIATFGLQPPAAGVRLIDPLGFFDFVALEQQARCVISDSGTVQEECSIFRRPNVTIRDVTERAETIECGSNILSGAEPDAIARAVRIALDLSTGWDPPTEYLARHVSDTVTKIVLGF